VSINTANARFYAVKTFLSVAYRDGYLTDAMAWRLNVTMFKRRVQRDNKPVGRRLSPSEVRKLRRAPDTDTLKGQRDLAILDCMLFAGLRRSEVASLKIGDIEVDNGRYWLIVTGKGRKTRRIKMHDTLYKSLTAWIDASDRASAHSQPIFVGMDRHGNLSGVAVNGSTVGRLVTQYGALSGLAPATAGELGKLSPLGAHDLRRTAARNAHDNGAPLLYIQKWLGHKDPKTTARYIGLGEDDSDTATDYVHY
jgi:integrase